jgi:hypothetical protein
VLAWLPKPSNGVSCQHAAGFKFEEVYMCTKIVPHFNS